MNLAIPSIMITLAIPSLMTTLAIPSIMTTLSIPSLMIVFPQGTVECDAGIMESSGLRHGAVGAVSGIQHPICVAHKLLTLQSKPLLGNLVPPALLVGSGAVEWAAANGIDTCEESKLVSGISVCVQTVLDTVGCVAVSADGTVAAGASSGGILLKTPGRVGQSAVLGAGYWAENDCKGSGRNIAVCTSGCGEMLVSSHLAMNAAAAVASTADGDWTDLPRPLKALLLDSKFLKSYSRPKSSGCLILKHNPAEGYTDLYCCHSSISFGFAYMGAEDENPKVSDISTK
ncbi:hypothetical protein HAZT_HAZT000990 [Hyalella azteca]|uniref:Uncharacterized protein n=1 Tax=Hyalella azteca TaxID=294128 RepID=A0A6A0GVU0_HYAAZ|nr:hypothetical protein HAZT_HAZT000990 [Hyalella azteca]